MSEHNSARDVEVHQHSDNVFTVVPTGTADKVPERFQEFVTYGELSRETYLSGLWDKFDAKIDSMSEWQLRELIKNDARKRHAAKSIRWALAEDAKAARPVRPDADIGKALATLVEVIAQHKAAR